MLDAEGWSGSGMAGRVKEPGGGGCGTRAEVEEIGVEVRLLWRWEEEADEEKVERRLEEEMEGLMMCLSKKRK